MFSKEGFERAKKEYFIAKVKVNILREELEKINKPVEEALEAGKITSEEWATIITDNEYETDYPELVEEEWKAKDRVIALAGEGMKQHMTPAQWEQVKPVYETKLYRIRDKVLDLSLRWTGE